MKSIAFGFILALSIFAVTAVAQPVPMTITIGNTVVNEGDGIASLLVSRNLADGLLCVDYEDQQYYSSATQGSDYQKTRGELCWNDGDTSERKVKVPIIDDNEVEPDEEVVIGLIAASLPEGVELANRGLGTVLIKDNDRPATPVPSLGVPAMILLSLALLLMVRFSLARTW